MEVTQAGALGLSGGGISCHKVLAEMHVACEWFIIDMPLMLKGGNAFEWQASHSCSSVLAADLLYEPWLQVPSPRHATPSGARRPQLPSVYTSSPASALLVWTKAGLRA